MVMLNSSTGRLVKSAEFANAPYSSTLKRIHGWFLLFNVVRIHRIILTEYCLDAAGNIQRIIVFAQTKVRMEVNHLMEVIL